jgi:hypothetical protein
VASAGPSSTADGTYRLCRMNWYIRQRPCRMVNHPQAAITVSVYQIEAPLYTHDPVRGAKLAIAAAKSHPCE